MNFYNNLSWAIKDDDDDDDDDDMFLFIVIGKRPLIAEQRF